MPGAGHRFRHFRLRRSPIRPRRGTLRPMTLAAVFPPMVTPFRDDEVDAKAIRWNVERWMRGGLGGVVALGTNGEAGLLDESEADRVLEAVRDAVPADRLVIAGTG